MKHITNQTYTENISHVQDLIFLMSTRRNRSTFEEAYVKNVALQLGITQEDYMSLTSGTLRKVSACNKSMDKSIVMFHRFILLINVDGYINAERIDMCRNYALKNGLNLYAVEEILKQIIEKPYRIIPIKSFIQTFKTYLN